MNLLIKNGTIINHEISSKADILIEEGKIVKIGNGLEKTGCEIFDAENCLLIPGGVDVHTHMDLDLGKFRVIDDFYTGTVAAAYGGTTSIVDHIAFGPKGCNLHYKIDEYRQLANKKSIIDYSFHGVIQHVDNNVLEEMKDLSNEGITSFKIYMTYDNMINDEDILKLLFRAKELGVVIAVHAENDGAIKHLREKYANENKTQSIYHAMSRPDSTEAEAINRMIYLSEIAGYPNLYFVHVSSKKGLDEIISARKKGAKNIYCETCVQYLIFDEDCYNKENYEGLKYIMAPPLRKIEDINALWNGVENGDIDVIATDHCPFTLEEKMMGKNDYRLAPGGVSGVEERMEVVLTEGVKRGISINLLVGKLSFNPAKIYGLSSKKGSIEIGKDADIVIMREARKKLVYDNRHSSSNYSIYDGHYVDFVVDTVIQRGNILIEKEKLLAQRGCGLFLKRNLY